MKTKLTKLLVLAILIALPISSYAVVVDTFKCELTINDYKTNQSSKQNIDIQMARLPSPINSFLATQAKSESTIKLNNEASSITVRLFFEYQHAMRTVVDNGVTQIDVRQGTCLWLTGSYCEKTSPENPSQCTTTSNICMMPPDPFDPTYGWTPVPFLDDAHQDIPAFNTKSLATKTWNIQDPAGNYLVFAKLDCQYTGTVN